MTDEDSGGAQRGVWRVCASSCALRSITALGVCVCDEEAGGVGGKRGSITVALRSHKCLDETPFVSGDSELFFCECETYETKSCFHARRRTTGLSRFHTGVLSIIFIILFTNFYTNFSVDMFLILFNSTLN